MTSGGCGLSPFSIGLIAIFVSAAIRHKTHKNGEDGEKQ